MHDTFVFNSWVINHNILGVPSQDKETRDHNPFKPRGDTDISQDINTTLEDVIKHNNVKFGNKTVRDTAKRGVSSNSKEPISNSEES
jgi:hypothetical protein